MPSLRKRKFTSNSSTPKKSTKKSKKAARVRHLQEESDASGVDSDVVPDKFWKIRDILDEKSGKYLIAWEDDPDTGEAFEPTWERKQHLNAQAVAHWEQKKSRARQGSAAQPKKNQERVLPGEKRKIGGPSDRSKRRRHRTVVDLSSSPLREIEKTQEVAEVADSQLPLLPSVDEPGIAVQISPHSSLDRQQFLQYSSNLGAHLTSGLQTEQIDPVSSEPSLASTQLDWVDFNQSGIVPDSQSLGNSASYAATESKTNSGPGITQSSTEVHSNSPSNLLVSLSVESPNAPSDPIQDSSYAQGATAATLETNIYIYGPLPLQNCGQSSTILDTEVTRPLKHIRSCSEPARSIESTSRDRRGSSDYLPESQSLGNPSLLLESSAFEPLTQGRSTLPTLELEDAILQPTVFEPTRIYYNQLQDSDVVDKVGTRGSQDQGSCALDNQDSRNELEISPVAEGIWQSGQVIQLRVASVSEISSHNTQEGTTTAISEPSVKGESLADESFLETTPFVAPQEYIENNQNSNTIGNSILSQRDPNSQPERNLHSAQSKGETTLLSIESPDLILDQTTSSVPQPAPSQIRETFGAIPLPRNVALSSVEESDIIAEEVSSSIPPPAASQSPETFDSNPPPGPLTSSELTMSDEPFLSIASALRGPQSRLLPTAPAPMSFREKLRSMRAASAATSAARRAALEASPAPQGTKSPSVIPQPATRESFGDSRLEIQTVEIPLPLRSPLVDTYAPLQPSKLALHKEMSQARISKALDSPRLGANEFVVSLPAVARVRDQYVEQIGHYRKSIQRFAEAEVINEDLIQEMQDFLTSLNNVSVHIDLDNDTTLTQEDIPPGHAMEWATASSAKFLFLKHLISALLYQDVHIAIVAHGDRLLDIIETFLKAMYVAYSRPDISIESDPKNTKGRVHISLFVSGEKEVVQSTKAISLILAFDCSFSAKDPQVIALRAQKLKVGQPIPVVHLLVYASSEHIERCMPDHVTGVERLKVMVNCVTQAREAAGELLPTEAKPAAAAEEVAAFVEAGGLRDQWTLPCIRPIEISYDLIEASQDQTSTTQSDSQTTREESILSQGIRKRSSDAMDLDDAAAPKRQRTTPAPEISHVSNSVDCNSQALSQTVLELRNSLQEAHTKLVRLQTSRAARETSMQASIDSLESRLQEHVDALSDLQYRYEERNAEYHALRHEKTELISTAALADRKRENQASEIASLKEERTRLENELRGAREALVVCANPDLAALEKAKEEGRAAAQENVLLQKRVASLQADFEFTRQQYQLASGAAAESASRITELEGEIQTLRQRASGEAARFKGVTNQNENEAHAKRIAELEALLEEREDLLRKKERGRGVQTRSGSVQPRSPRPGNSRAGSRAGSPMGGYLGVSMTKTGSGLRFG